METTWVVVANRAGARVLQAGADQALIPLQDIAHAEGRLQAREIDSDKRGRTFDRMGQHHHASESEVSPTQTVAERFAKELADLLYKGRTEHQFDKLVLIAEPGFLGDMRAKLDQATAKTVVATVAKDLLRSSEQDLERYVAAELRPH